MWERYFQTNRTTGLYVELKHPSFFRSLGFDIEAMLLESLVAGGYAVMGPTVPRDLHRVLPVVVECFDEFSLQILRKRSDLPLILLLEQPDSDNVTSVLEYWSDTTLAHYKVLQVSCLLPCSFLSYLILIQSVADGVGPDKSYFGALPLKEGRHAVQRAHDIGLYLHPWTFRAESQYIIPKFHGDFQAEQEYFYCCLGIDGLFTEFPDRTREVVDAFIARRHVMGVPLSSQCSINCEHPAVKLPLTHAPRV
jgi:glycerophosphoryl diester phosphodiesterase